MKFDIFTEINSLPESAIVSRLGLETAKDGKSYVCPICEHGKGGDGLKYRNGRWECYGGCHRSRSSVDLIAACCDIKTTDKAELATKLREVMGYEDVNETFSFQRKKEPVKKVAHVVEDRDFASLYKRCRINYRLSEFVEKCGGTWRGLTYETLRAAGCLFHAEYTISAGVCVPAVIFPYDKTLYYWRRVDEVPEGEMKGGVPKDSKRKPYIVAPISLDFPNFIVEGEVDALSIVQVWPYSGVVATGGVNFTRHLVAYLKNQFGTAERKPLFVVLFDNDKAGKVEGEKLTSALNAAGFLTEQFYFEERMKGNYIRYSTRDEETRFFQPKVDANDLLQQGEKVLRDRLFEIFEDAGNLLELRAEALGRKTPWQKTNGAH